MAPRLVPTQFENVPRDMQPDDDERNDDVSLLDSYSNLRHTVGQIGQKCKETSNLMLMSYLWFFFTYLMNLNKLINAL